jgi:predicted PurR-regulated permease PerM
MHSMSDAPPPAAKAITGVAATVAGDGRNGERIRARMRRLVVAGLLGALLLVGFVVLRPFLAPIAWAAILCYVTWPLHQRVQARLHGHRNAAALAMTLLLALALGIALLWLGLMLRRELAQTVREAVALLRAGPALPETVLNIPWLGPWLQQWLIELGADRAAWGRQLAEASEQWGGRIMRVVGDVGLNALRFGIALLTAYFLFRDGDRWLAQLRGLLHALLGSRVKGYFSAVGNTARAVVYGLLLAALAQGLMAGLGYWAVGVSAPAFWGTATALIALIPFGAVLVWASIGVWLLLQGQFGAGIGLLLWGALAVSWIDNLVRPLVISGVAKIPFLLVLFGVFGGLAAFGLIGLFVGPMVLAVLLALWREWVGAVQAEAAPE